MSERVQKSLFEVVILRHHNDKTEILSGPVPELVLATSLETARMDAARHGDKDVPIDELEVIARPFVGTRV